MSACLNLCLFVLCSGWQNTELGTVAVLFKRVHNNSHGHMMPGWSHNIGLLLEMPIL